MVQEHRITLGDYERKQLEEAVTATRVDQDLRMAVDVVNAVAMPVAVGVAGFFVYRGMNGWGTGRDKIAEWWENLTSPATGPTVSDAPAGIAAVFDGFAKFVFGPLGYEGGGTFSDGSSFGDAWKSPDGPGGGGF